MTHPYASQSNRAFWSRSVSRNFNASETIPSGAFFVQKGEQVISAGSCFASNIVPYLEKHNIEYVRTERDNPIFGGLDTDNFGYSKFSAKYGNIYTPRQLLQLVQRARGTFQPVEDRWRVGAYLVDPFRPGLKFRPKTDQEFDALQRQHFACTLNALAQAQVFVFTLGLTEAWVSRKDGAVFPACPGTITGEFDPDLHQFINFSVAEVTADICSAIGEIREVNAHMRFILTVSPVPLVATATPGHVLVASSYSKSVLRVAAQEVSQKLDQVAYFPALEIVTGPQAPKSFFEPDRRNVSEEAVAEVMGAFLSHCDVDLTATQAPRPMEQSFNAALSELIAKVECEEAAADRGAAAAKA